MAVPDDDSLCRPCQIERDSGPQAKRDYLSGVGRKGAFASRRVRTPGIEEEDLGPHETAEDAMRWSRVIALALAPGRISSSRANALRGLIKQWQSSRESHLTEEKMQELEERLNELRSQGVI